MAAEEGRTGFHQPQVVSPKHVHIWKTPKGLSSLYVYFCKFESEQESWEESKEAVGVNTVNKVLMHEILRNFKK